MRLRTSQTWKLDGACRQHDPAIFFPSQGEDVRPARAICFTCPVFDQCYEAGIREKHGIWGGTSEKERKRLRRDLGISAYDDELPAEPDIDDLEVA